MVVTTFGSQLRRYRLRKKWTLRQMSIITGFPEATLSRIENHKVTPHLLTKAKIEDALPDFVERETSEVA